MSDKDQFTFDDDDDFPETNLGGKSEPQKLDLDDAGSPENGLTEEHESQELDLSYAEDFPETDLSDAFSEGEHVAGDSVLDVPEKQVKGGGNSKTRILLMVLLLVIAVGAGAYYFMGLGGTTPSVPTVPVAAKKTTKSVALPAQSPKQAPVTPAKLEPVKKPVTVAVPPPPPEPTAKVAPTKQAVAVATKQAPPKVTPAAKVVVEKPKIKPAEQSSVKVAVPAPQAKPVEKKSAPVPAPLPAPQKATVSAPPAPAPAVSAQAAATPKPMVGGVFALDAGSYLLKSNRDSLVAKIKKLGYEPFVTPVDATLDMTRLRLGTFSKDELQEALSFARSIEPGAFSAPAGEGYVVYAGTFLKSKNVDKLSQRFLEEGIKVHAEPIQVVKTLSRIRFGSFATKEDAAVVAKEVAAVGIQAEVVKSK